MLANITAPDFTRDVSTWFRFRTAKPNAVAAVYVNGVPTVLEAADGVFTVNLNNSDGVFVTID